MKYWEEWEGIKDKRVKDTLQWLKDMGSTFSFYFAVKYTLGKVHIARSLARSPPGNVRSQSFALACFLPCDINPTLLFPESLFSSGQAGDGSSPFFHWYRAQRKSKARTRKKKATPPCALASNAFSCHIKEKNKLNMRRLS